LFIDPDQKSPLLNARRFLPQWSVEEQSVCVVVKDDAGQKLA
jgi:hypothetical protein